jgi:hypothetical protein
MAERKGVLQILDDFSFSLQRSGAVGILLDRLSVDCFTHKRTKKEVVQEVIVPTQTDGTWTVIDWDNIESDPAREWVQFDQEDNPFLFVITRT